MADQNERKIDNTSILHGKKVNPRTGTQTSHDSEQGVQADNVHNEIQIEQAAHTLVQTTEGAGELLGDVLDQGNDGNVTPVQAKPTTAAGVQNDGAPVVHTAQEEVQKDGKVQQGETGPEKRTDLSDEFGGGSGDNIAQTQSA